MKCEKCGSEKIQIISEYIETKEKSGNGIFATLLGLSISGTVIGSILIFYAIMEATSSKILEILLSAPLASLGLKLMGYCLTVTIATCLIRIFAPFKHVTKTKAVCMDCSNTWHIEEKVK